MTERNPNLLLSDAAAPANGIVRTRVVHWHGGNLNIAATGVFDGATINVVFCAKLPKTGDRDDYTNAALFPATDFIEMDAATAPGLLELGNVGPCALLVKVANVGTSTRVRMIVV